MAALEIAWHSLETEDALGHLIVEKDRMTETIAIRR